MKTHKRITCLPLALAVVALLGFSGLASAQMMGPGMMGGQGMGMMGGNMMMNLPPEKQAAAQKIYADFNTKTATMRQQLAAKQYELNAQLYSATPDDKKVQALTKDISDLNAKLFEAQVALQNQLTKEGIPAMSGMGMMGGMNCPMMGGSMGMGGMGMGY
jgi:zinc resistance-associated protein